MLETLSILPLPFWLAIALLVAGGIWAVRHLRDGTGAPTFAVLGTVAFWYVGDAFYNNYAGYHATIFESFTLQLAWWEVAWFLTAFLLAVPLIHRWINARLLRQCSGVFQMFKYGVGQPMFQRQLNRLFLGSALVWLILILVAAIRVQGGILYVLFPFLGSSADPWGRGRIGSGFDALLSVAFYFQLLTTGIFGVVAALATNRRIRQLALVCCLFSMPYFIFQRTRNMILAAVIPGVLSWGFLGVRGGMLKKIAMLGACFLIVNAWMGFIIANRSTNSVMGALQEKGFSLSSDSKVHHEGLNMYEELCWINTFMDEGTYHPNWGSRYFAEAVNIIPRSLWPGKPLIGIDYSLVRGGGAGAVDLAGVTTTFSTGLIGQGVVNFGRFLGPFAAAVLMSFWVAVLARLDLRIEELGRLPLYFCGLILTFNLGRDITLMTLYPFVFGYLAFLWLDRWSRSSLRTVRRDQRPRKPVPLLNPQRGPLRFGRRRSNISATTMKMVPRKPMFRYVPGTGRNHL